MSLWTGALADERKEKAKELYCKLKAINWDRLSANDRILMNLLGWFCLEEDDCGEPAQFIEHDFEETD